MGFGWATQDSPTLLSGTQNLALASFSPLVAGQVKVGKSFAVLLGFSGVVITGINTNSIINYGATVQYSYLLGVLYEITRSEKTVFSVGLQLQHPHTLAISPAGIIPQAIQNIVGAASPNFQSSSVQEVWTPTLRIAHAFLPEFALKADLGANLSSYTDEDTTDARSQGVFGLGIETDLNPLLHVALGITLNYTRNQVLVPGASNSDTFEFGLYETFRHAFNAGFELGKVYRNGINASVGALVLRTYYN